MFVSQKTWTCIQVAPNVNAQYSSNSSHDHFLTHPFHFIMHNHFMLHLKLIHQQIKFQVFNSRADNYMNPTYKLKPHVPSLKLLNQYYHNPQ
jgi:hypothetical protein